MVIANTQGGYIGVFSDMGHCIVLASAQNKTGGVCDPMYRAGGRCHDREGRAVRV